jgi:hypothetical protein
MTKGLLIASTPREVLKSLATIQMVDVHFPTTPPSRFDSPKYEGWTKGGGDLFFCVGSVRSTLLDLECPRGRERMPEKVRMGIAMKATLLCGMGLAFLAGCSQMVNRFRDEYAHRPPVTTPSVEAVLAAEVPPSVQERHGDEKLRCAVDGSITHLPLYFEDPTEESGSENGHFAWTGEDYLWIAYWRVRFMANLIALPVSAVVNPPCQTMVSDGRRSGCGRGRQFDAEPCRDH